MKKVFRAVLLMAAVWGSCNSERELQPDSYLMYMEDVSNEYRRTISSGEISYTIQFATPEYIACKDNRSNVEGIQARVSELEENIFFIIHIAENPNKSSVESSQCNPEQKAMYYQFEAMKDISLVADEQAFIPTTYHYEDNYGLTPYNTIVVGFDRPTGANNLQLVFHDRFNDKPYIKSTYTEADIKKLPKLKII